MERDKTYSEKDIAEVADSPEWMAEEMARSKNFAEAFPDLAESLEDRVRVEIVDTTSVRLAADVLAHDRVYGDDWEDRINADLRKAAGLKA